MARAEAYLHTKFHLDPSNRLATVQERHRQTGQDRQRSDSITANGFTNGRPKIVATRYQILRLKYTKIDFSRGLPQIQMGELTALPQAIAGIMGAYF